MASKDMGEPVPEADRDAAEPAKSTEPAAAETQTAALQPNSAAAPELVSALPAPAATTPDLALPRELPVSVAAPAPAPAAPASRPRAEPRRKQPAVARTAARPRGPPRVPGPDATKDEYFAYCEALIRRHYGMVPAALLAGRNGDVSLNIVVLGDGTIARISIRRSSGRPDIDARIEQMVAAVRRFPPLPQWFQEPSMPMIYHQAIRDGQLH
jgi:TonB family protein